MKRFCLPVSIGVLLLAFWVSPDAQAIAVGVAIFLFGMLMLEDGFKLFGGGTLEMVLERATSSTLGALLFGILSTTLLQSSSLVSIVTISFLSAGLISLLGGHRLCDCRVGVLSFPLTLRRGGRHGDKQLQRRV